MTLCQEGGNGRRERAAGAVGVFRCYLFGCEGFNLAIAQHQNIGHFLPYRMAALHQHILTMILLNDGFATFRHIADGLDFASADGFRFREVGREEGADGEQLLFQQVKEAVGGEVGAAGGHQNGVQHQRIAVVVAVQGGSNGPHVVAGINHSDFDSGHGNILQDCVDLVGQHGGIHRLYRPNAAGVLRRHCGDGRRRIMAQGKDGLDVGLDAGTAHGITPRNRENALYFIHNPLILNEVQKKKVVLKFKSLVRITEPVNGYDLSLLLIQHPSKTGCKSTLFFCGSGGAV